MKRRILFVVLISLAAASASWAQSSSTIEYNPINCIRAGELPLLQVSLDRKGELRAYFRKTNTSDWCSVEGVNAGPLSRVVLPKFDPTDEIEYFFVLIDGIRVVSRSPRIYRVRVTTDCELPFARHVQQLDLSCGDDPTGIATAAGLSLLDERERPVSPDSPEGQ